MKVVLLLGGSSPERLVSIASGRGIVRALREIGHKVTVVDPAQGNHQVPEEELFSQSVGEVPPRQEFFESLSPANYIRAIESSVFDDVDVAFIILHGKYGEDGIIQSLLELRGVPYTGSGVMASALAMDKAMSKKLFRHHGIPTADWIDYNRNSTDRRTIIRNGIPTIGYPNVVKPNDQGSSVAITIVKEPGELERALDEAEECSDTVLVEKYVSGAELTVSILGNEPLPVIEIRPEGGFYDYHHKYTRGMTEYLVPAPLEKNFAIGLQDTALKTFNALGCKTFGRVDFRIGEDQTAYCLEVNTIPGMTETSLVPKAAAAAGISFNQVVRKIVELTISDR